MLKIEVLVVSEDDGMGLEILTVPFTLLCCGVEVES